MNAPSPAPAYLGLLLHAHLPYVRHPEHADFYEERWLFEAISECYIPLLTIFERLHREAVPFRVTLSFSPTLTSMLRDPLLQQRYRAHLEKMLELARHETRRSRHHPELAQVTALYQYLFERNRQVFEHWQGDLLEGFRRLQAAGCLELITCGATHAYLPVWRQHPAQVRIQIELAVDSHRRTFGTAPAGIWLPECGYYPGLETVLKESGLGYFVVDSHGLLNASEAPRDGTYAPLACPNGVVAFGRDPDSSQRVWSADSGYPGNPVYRDFYRDIGFDLPLSYIGPYILDHGTTRIHTGFKYYRISARDTPKELYQPEQAAIRTEYDAQDFLRHCVQRTSEQCARMARPPLLTAPYDAELFGHWWFEGPAWLSALFRRMAVEPALDSVTLGEYARRFGEGLQVAVPSASSWGEQGYNHVWLNPVNDWLYPHLHRAARDMQILAREHPAATGLQRRALNQAGRSLLLAQASDWPFLLKNGTAKEYARQRISDHLARFHYLATAIEGHKIEPVSLQALEVLDNIFSDLDYRWFVGE